MGNALLFVALVSAFVGAPIKSEMILLASIVCLIGAIVTHLLVSYERREAIKKVDGTTRISKEQYKREVNQLKQELHKLSKEALVRETLRRR